MKNLLAFTYRHTRLVCYYRVSNKRWGEEERRTMSSTACNEKRKAGKIYGAELCAHMWKKSNLLLLSAHGRSNPIATLLLMALATSRLPPARRKTGICRKREKGRKEFLDEEVSGILAPSSWQTRKDFLRRARTERKKFLIEGREKWEKFYPESCWVVLRKFHVSSCSPQSWNGFNPPAATMMRRIDRW